MSVDVYNSQISANQQAIISYQNEIGELEHKISELTAMNGRVASVQEELARMSDRECEKLNCSLPFLNPNFWGKLLEAIKGSEYQAACDGVRISQDIIQDKIRELNQKIEQNYQEINQCRAQISSLESQKAAFLEAEAQREAEARRAAEVAAGNG